MGWRAREPASNRREIPYGSTWRYLLTGLDSTDRSAPDFDDSGWSEAPAPFSDRLADHPSFDPGHWLTPVTIWPLNSAVWVRKALGPGITAAHVSVRYDDGFKVYWNGTELTSVAPGVSSGDRDYYPVPAALLGGTNVVAVRGADAAATNSSDRCYLDVRVEYEIA